MMTNFVYLENFATNETDTATLTLDNAYFFIMAMKVA